MTCYEWQPGNKYGDFVAPQYNALSYTWGRFRLEDGEFPKFEVIKIEGILWDVPRIRDTRFTADQFKALIKKATEVNAGDLSERMIPSAAFTANPRNQTGPIKFVWLDIACIDRRPGSAEGLAEIGRQAAIFREAKHVIIWLAQHTHEQLNTCLKFLKQAERMAEKVWIGGSSTSGYPSQAAGRSGKEF
jgi:hypothetical protein